jgi:large conductance mechanosensitive channel
MPNVITEFRKFLREFNVLTVAVGFVIGTAVRDYVRAVVDDFVMPAVNVLMPDVDWACWVWGAGEAKIKIGDLLARTIDLGLVVLVIFTIARLAKAATKPAGGK